MEGTPKWSVFDGAKTTIPPASPESLMAEINAAISALEHARASAPLDSPSLASPSSSAGSRYDAQMADEAYKAGCAALKAGKLKEGLQSLNLSLAKCPPDRTSAVVKLRSLISHTLQQLQRSSKSRN